MISATPSATVGARWVTATIAGGANEGQADVSILSGAASTTAKTYTY